MTRTLFEKSTYVVDGGAAAAVATGTATAARVDTRTAVARAREDMALLRGEVANLCMTHTDVCIVHSSSHSVKRIPS
jgi:hypothetical protein